MSGRGFIKHIRWTGPGGIQWDIPAWEIARLYANDKMGPVPYQEKRGAYDQAHEEIMSDDVLLLQWAIAELSWEDIAPIATLVPAHRPEFDKAWREGKREIVIYKTF